MPILSDLFRTGLGMAANYGMSKIPDFYSPSESSTGTGQDKAVAGQAQGNTGADRALGSSGINMQDPLTSLAMRNLTQGVTPFKGGGILSSLANTGLQTGMQMGLTKLLPMIASMFA